MRLKLEPDTKNIEKFLDELGVEDTELEIECVNDTYKLHELMEVFQLNMIDSFNDALREYSKKIDELIENADVMYDIKDQRAN